eukprot:TRINITY_DN6630_c0_g1_i1.p1 TRINITY_DN6630_c0_g1~~TRINITY_DN6630_c0_g1_i1.p1  ORF type:complete len:381 (-),score=50.44 TRINITY_DN6630_c0_g1_i1:724-1866(-)
MSGGLRDADIFDQIVKSRKISEAAVEYLLKDVEFRLRSVVQKSLCLQKRSKSNVLTLSNIRHGMHLLGLETTGTQPSRFKINQDNGIKGGRAKSLLECTSGTSDREIDVDELLDEDYPKPNQKCQLSIHWLAIEGVQPTIIENPSPKAISINSNKNITYFASHVLSRELRLYFDKVISTVRDGPTAIMDAALESVSTDVGMHQLLPYFCQFIATTVANNLNNLELLKSVMKLLSAIVESRQLHLQPYLHQVAPCALTCVLSRKLCKHANENHWELRDYSARLVARICDKYGDTYKNFQGQISEMYVSALRTTSMPMTTHYGAIQGIIALGPWAVRLLLLPLLDHHHQLLTPLLHSQNPQKKEEANRCNQLLLKAKAMTES